MQVVFDTDVLIPMIVEASRSARLFSRLQSLGHDVLISPQILDEVAEKFRTKHALRKWLDMSDEEIEEFLHNLPALCRMLPGLVNAHGAVPADPKDDKIIAAAIEGQAEYIVSEDKHLRTLKQYQGIRIMSRDEFTAELDRLAAEESGSTSPGA